MTGLQLTFFRQDTLKPTAKHGKNIRGEKGQNCALHLFVLQAIFLH